MRKILNVYTLEILFILLVGLIPLLWYKPGYMALGHDMSYPLFPVEFFQDRLFTWTNRISTFGANQTDDLPGFFIHGLQAFTSFIGLPLIVSQQAVFMFWFVLPGLTMYILLRSLYPEKERLAFRLGGSLFYMMNHYLLQAWFIAEMTKFSIVSALPLVAFFIIKIVYKRQSIFSNSILLALSLFVLNGGPGIPLWGGLIITSVILFLSLFILSHEPFIPKLKRSFGFVISILLILLLLNAYWIFPYLKSYGKSFTQNLDAAGGSINITIWSKSLSKNASFTNLFKLEGIPDWYDNLEHPYASNFINNPILIFLSFVFPILGFLGLIKTKTESRQEGVYRISFLAVLIISIALTAGSHSPFGKIYDFALQNVPLFPMFRSPFYKFGMILWFAYSFFIGLGFYYLINLIRSRLLPKVSYLKLSFLMILIFFTLLSIYNYPFFTGSFFNWSSKYSTMVKVPDYVFDAKKVLDNKFSTRTLVIPNLDPRIYYTSYNWNYLSAAPLFYVLDRVPTLISQQRLSSGEKDLVDAIYTQLIKDGKSTLIQFTSTDRAIVQNDFMTPEHIGYSSESIKSKVISSADFHIFQKVGAWDFYDLSSDQITPLIYSPEKITYLSVSPQSLPIATEITSAPIIGDSFYNPNQQKQNNFLKINDSFTQYIIEGKCTNCENKVPITLETTPLIIQPGNPFYPVLHFFQNLTKYRISDPMDRNRFILEVMGRKIGSLGKSYIDNSLYTKKTAEVMLADLAEIRQNHFFIMDESKKEEDGARIYQFFKYYISYVRDWAKNTQVSDIHDNLDQIAKTMEEMVKEMGLVAGPSPWSEDSYLYEYKLIIPKDGLYQLSLYWPEKGRDNYEITLNGQTINLRRQDLNSNWLQSLPMDFKKTAIKLVIPRLPALPTETLSLQDTQLSSKKDEVVCQSYDIAPQGLRNDINYRIQFEENIISGHSPVMKIFEENKVLNLPEEERSFDFKYEILDGNPSHLKTTIVFKTALFSNSTTLKLCFNPEEQISIDWISHLTVAPLYQEPQLFAASVSNKISDQPIPNIEFVSLNQTKYLIRLTNIPQSFVLNFNSRLDDQWKIREVDYNQTAKYFTGNKRIYLGGRVIEYSKLDQHIITDIAFPTVSGQSTGPNLILNGFANGWLMENSSTTKQKAYLLEYTYQNDFYKASLVSLSTLLILLVLYFYGKKGNKG